MLLSHYVCKRFSSFHRMTGVLFCVPLCSGFPSLDLNLKRAFIFPFLRKTHSVPRVVRLLDFYERLDSFILILSRPHSCQVPTGTRCSEASGLLWEAGLLYSHPLPPPFLPGSGTRCSKACCWTSTRGRTPLFSSSPAPHLVRYRYHVLLGCWTSTKGRSPLLSSSPAPILVRYR